MAFVLFSSPLSCVFSGMVSVRGVTPLADWPMVCVRCNPSVPVLASTPNLLHGMPKKSSAVLFTKSLPSHSIAYYIACFGLVAGNDLSL